MPVLHHSICPLCGSDFLTPFLKSCDDSKSKQHFDLIRCEACGFVMTQDAPDVKAMGAYYDFEDYVSHSDTQQGLFFRLYHAVRTWMLSRKRRLIQRHVRGGTLLDIGCATGYFLAHMKTSGWDVKGVEPDEGARRMATEQFGLEVMSPSDWVQEGAGTFDVITLWHVLEHVHDLKGEISRIHRALKDDGLLVVALPNPKSVDAAWYKSAWAAYDVPRHLWHFSPENIETLMGQHGFQLVSRHRMGFDAFYVALLSERHRGGRFALIRGMIVGFVSWLACLLQKERCSSLIYLFKNK